MQKLRPYVLPGLFVFHLVVLCVMLTAAEENESSGGTAIVTIVSQFFLTALFAGLGPGSWSLRIPSWGALAALSWLSFVFFKGHGLPNGNDALGVPLAPLIVWIVLVSLLLCLRGIPFLKWRVALQPTLAAPQSNQPHQDSLTRGILIVVASWAGVLMLLKDSWPWSVAATAISESSDDLLMVSGIAALVGAGALVMTVLAVGLTLTRLADWMFYRRRWTLPLLAILLTGTAIMSLLNFGGPFRNGSERLLAVLWLLPAMAAQPLATLLVMGLTGYRLAPRKQPEPDASESSFQAATTTTEKPAANWFLRLQRPHIASLVAVLLFFVGFVPTGALNRHHINAVGFWLSPRLKNNAEEITHLTLNHRGTNNSLRVLSDLDNLQSLELDRTQVTDAGLLHLSGLTNLKTLDLRRTRITDAGLVHLKGVTNLRLLDLSGCQNITDAGLVHIKGMTKLKNLNLYRTQVTDTGTAELKQSLPNCEINHYW